MVVVAKLEVPVTPRVPLMVSLPLIVEELAEKAVAVVVAKVLVPCTVRVPGRVKLLTLKALAIKLEMVVVARVVVPVTLKLAETEALVVEVLPKLV
jgi:hypothetical protein